MLTKWLGRAFWPWRYSQRRVGAESRGTWRQSQVIDGYEGVHIPTWDEMTPTPLQHLLQSGPSGQRGVRPWRKWLTVTAQRALSGCRIPTAIDNAPEGMTQQNYGTGVYSLWKLSVMRWPFPSSENSSCQHLPKWTRISHPGCSIQHIFMQSFEYLG